MLAILFFLCLCLLLMSGFPVAFVLSGVSLLFALLGSALGQFDMSYLSALPGRIYGIMMNELLMAVPLFVFMGHVLERSQIAARLLESMTALFGARRAGMGISVLLVGTLLAASTGIVGATVVTMGLMSLPVMVQAGYCRRLSSGVICAAGTLGQIIPPSIVLILLGDQISSAWQAVQMERRVAAPEPVSIADIFAGALLPGLTLVGLYLLWMLWCALRDPQRAPPLPEEERARLFAEGRRVFLSALLPPLALILMVLGSILGGVATVTEAAAIGAAGAMLLAMLKNHRLIEELPHVMRETLKTSAMIFTILIGAAFFTLVFRGLGGEEMVHDLLSDLPGGLVGALLVTMLVMFLLGFFLDFIEITFVMVPVVAPVLLALGADPIWLAVLMAINLQTSFLTPPFGFSLFYLRGVAGDLVKTREIYKGALPFVGIQLLMLGLLALQPGLATWLPRVLYGTAISLDSEGTNITTPDVPGAGQAVSSQSDFYSDIDF